jgi:hypothetical protein
MNLPSISDAITFFRMFELMRNIFHVTRMLNMARVKSRVYILKKTIPRNVKRI